MMSALQGAREHPFQEGGGIERTLHRAESGEKILGHPPTQKPTEMLSFLKSGQAEIQDLPPGHGRQGSNMFPFERTFLVGKGLAVNIAVESLDII